VELEVVVEMLAEIEASDADAVFDCEALSEYDSDRVAEKEGEPETLAHTEGEVE
jgi:hypothetical protein